MRLGGLGRGAFRENFGGLEGKSVRGWTLEILLLIFMQISYFLRVWGEGYPRKFSVFSSDFYANSLSSRLHFHIKILLIL